jgi:hypothetical protein
MFCIITNQTQANVWLTSVVLDQLLVTYASSQWRGEKFLIEHVINIKTLNGSEHDRRSFFLFFLLKLKILEAKVKFWCGHTHDTTFSDKILDFYKILEESEQFFISFLKKMENRRRFFSIFEVRGSNLKKKLDSGKSGASESKELKLKLVWPKHINILFIFSVLFFRYSNMITFFWKNW